MRSILTTGTVVVLLATVLTACGGGSGGAPASTNVNAQIRQAAKSQGLKGFPKLNEPNLTSQQSEIRELRRELGRNLFFDHVMSGVQHTSCGTCHHAAFQFSDARNIARGTFCDLSPSHDRITCHDAPTPGTNGNVVGPERTSPLNSRNSPLLVNAALFPRQMWNG